ncbi:MAG: hypothetical protein E7157_01780 [Lactobacillales bacterium]|nr:hypothetical protein [Lactobacillales bacterium]
MNRVSNIVWGILLIIVGVVTSLNILEITNINLLFDGWWTLVIIIPCLINVIMKKNIFANTVGIIIGIILLLCCQNILDFELVLRLSIPVLLIVLGVQFILNSKENK